MKLGSYAARLRVELGVRNRIWARDRGHVESYGRSPVVVYAPDGVRHGNFLDAAYEAIAARAEWMRRFDKIHAQCRSLPKAERRWRELDSSMSSDALLMNVFCTPGVVESNAVQLLMGVGKSQGPEFGWKARVPLSNERFDRTEVDMRWGDLLVEAKLTESDYQCREAAVVEGYRNFDHVFDRSLLPRVEIRMERRRTAVEFAEDYTQEWEAPCSDEGEAAQAFQAEIMARAEAPGEAGYAGYQLIRNVLAAYASESSFCVIHDERRPDLREAWFEVMAAVKSAEMRVRCKVLTWQELAAALPDELQAFLHLKYGIVAPGLAPSQISEEE